MDNLFYILASVIPSVLFLSLVLYILVIKRMSSPKLIRTQKPLRLIGVSTKSSDANIDRDDALLWEEFKKVRVKHGLPKPMSTVIVRLHTKKGESLYQYFIGMVGSSNNLPEGYEYLEIPIQTYVTSRHRFKKGTSWLKSATKIKFYIYDKWLPVSKYELNRDQDIKAVEVHNISRKTGKRNTQIFVAVKEVDQKRYL